MIHIVKQHGFLWVRGLPVDHQESIKSSLSLPNPLYERMRRSGRQAWWIKQYIEYFVEYDDKTLVISRGCLKRLLEYYPNAKVEDNHISVSTTSPIHSSIVLRDYQEGVIEEVIKHECGVLKLSTGFGKAQPIDTLIPSDDGYVKLGDVREGDRVFTPSGETEVVAGVFPQGIVDTYKVTFSDGSSTECCGDHIWSVRPRANVRDRVKYLRLIKTSDLIGDLKMTDGHNKWFIPITEPCKFTEKRLPLDPYLVGALIGNGSISCSLHFVNPDDEIIELVRDKVEKHKGHTLENPSGDNLHHSIKSNQHSGKGDIRICLDDLGLFGKRSYDKRIPKDYLRGSVEQRIELLRGLMDTDGTVHHKSKNCTYSTSSKGLCDDIVELLRSLGGVPTVNIKKPFYRSGEERVYCRDSYRIRVSITINPFRLSRKANLWNANPKQGRTRAIKSIEYIGKKGSVCIKLNNEEGLYLTNDFIVTHNTIIALELFRQKKQKTLLVVHRGHLLQQYENDIKKYFKNIDLGIIQGKNESIGDITIATIQTLGKVVDKYRDSFGMVIVDEVQEYITKKRLKTIQALNARYLYGMSGTPDRTDGQGRAIFWTFGDIIMEKSIDQIQPVIYRYKSNVHIPISEYAEMITNLIENEKRNALIVNLTNEKIKHGRRVLLLTKRVAHIDILKRLIPKSIALYSGTSSDILKKLRSNKATFSVLIGTYSLLATGSDVPSLDTLVFAGDLKSSVLNQQSIGRIVRVFEGKQDPEVIDIVDNKNGILYNQARERFKLYNKLNWQVYDMQ